MSEKIFGITSITANIFHKEDDTRSLLTNNIDITEESLCVITRPECEKDTAYRHFATYAIIQDEEGKILVYPRAKGGAEERLHGMWSIGWGGHVNINNHDKANKLAYATGTYLNALLTVATSREIAEELFGFPEDSDDFHIQLMKLNDVNSYYAKRVVDGVSDSIDITNSIHTPFTYLFDNSNEVGKRHIAAISRHVLTADDIAKMSITEETKGCKWMTLSEIRANATDAAGMKFENWSKVLIDNFESLRGNYVPSSCQYGESPFGNNTLSKYLKV